MDKMKFELVLRHGCFTEKNNFFPFKTMHFFFSEKDRAAFAQLFKFDSSSSFRNISINKKNRISYYITISSLWGQNNYNIDK